ncbi:MAG: DNA repair exonuclease [Coriobacteriia bacterium]|nr:DNA repair exonuclease [Coriobacteriia bacterium]
MEKVKFIHAADLHLGAPLLGVDPNDPLIDAANKAFDNAIKEAIKRKVDFFIISGDVFDRKEIPYEDYKFFIHEINKLDVPVFLCAGNHDPFESWKRTKTYGPLPEHLHLFPQDMVAKFDVGSCTIAGISYPQNKYYLNQFAKLNKQDLSIGVLHTGLDIDETIMPVKKEELDVLEFDYWALGHIHKRETFKLNNTIAYSGCTQGLHINSSSTNGVNYVELTKGKCDVEFIPTAKVKWLKLDIDVSDCDNLDDVLNLCRSKTLNYYTRITLTGKTKLHNEFNVKNLTFIQNQLTNCQKITDETTNDYNLEALKEEGLFPSYVLNTEVGDKKTKLAVLDILGINE